MAQLVLITRPLEQAQKFAETITSLGYSPLISPLLTIENIPTDFEKNDAPDAFIVSSVQALTQLHIPMGWAHIPVFCVGDLTANAARDAGFQNIISGKGGIADLAPLINHQMKPHAKLVYLRGEHVHQDINALLQDYEIREILMYRAHALQHFSAQILDQFDKIDIVTLFSSRTALIFKELIEKNKLTPYLKNIKLLCLSPSVVESVKEMGWKECHIADFPNQAALIEKLKSL